MAELLDFFLEVDTAAVQTVRYLRYRVQYLGIVPQPSTAVQGGTGETCDLRTYDVQVRDFARETQLVFPPIVGGQPVGDNFNVMSVQNIANLRSTVMWYRSHARGAVRYREYRGTGPVSQGAVRYRARVPPNGRSRYGTDL